MFRKLAFLVALQTLVLAGVAFAQQSTSNSQPDGDSDKGFVSFAEFGGSVNSSGHVLKLETSAGYNFSQHVGIDFGVPFYFVGSKSTSITGTNTNYSGSGIGAPYADLRLTFRNPALNYASTFMTFFPAGDKDKGFSTGRTAFDWNNHFERSFSRFTPFGEAGLGNTVADTSKFNRPYSSYGYNAHLQAGITFDIADKFNIGGSVYDILPWGTQTIYSRTLPKSSAATSANASAPQMRVFDQNPVVTGTSSLGKDHGFSAWADFNPVPYITAELGYTRSVPFDLDTVSFGIRLNIGYLAKKSAQ